MTVTYRCPNMKCRKILHVPSSLRGNNVRCSYCGTIHGVPRAKTPQKNTNKKTVTGFIASVGIGHFLKFS